MRLVPKFLLSAMSPDHFPNTSRTADAPEIAFLGRSNVGKSSLINKLLSYDPLVVGVGLCRTYTLVDYDC